MRAPGPIDRDGPANVVRRLLGLKANDRPAFAIGDVQPVAEVRGLRYWEAFDEGQQRWTVYCNSSAVAAQFSGADITGLDVGSGLPKGTLWTIDRVRNYSAQRVFVGIGSGHSLVGTPAPVHLDRRWGSTLTQPQINVTVGSSAAPGLTVLHELMPVPTVAAPGSADEVEVEYVGVDPNPDIAIGLFMVSGSIVSTATIVSISGRIILP